LRTYRDLPDAADRPECLRSTHEQRDRFDSARGSPGEGEGVDRAGRLDFATSSGQWVGLSPLVETLRHDIGAATGSLPTAPRKRRQLSFLQAFLLSVAGALAGALVGGEIGSAIAPKGDPNALLDLSGLDYIGYCVMIGFFVGAAAMTLVGSWLPRLLDMAVDHRGAELPKGWE
jgi:hypothetical protein